MLFMTGECIMYKWSINHFKGKVIWKAVALKLSIFIKIVAAARYSPEIQSLPHSPMWGLPAVQHWSLKFTQNSILFSWTWLCWVSKPSRDTGMGQRRAELSHTMYTTPDQFWNLHSFECQPITGAKFAKGST